MSDKKEISIESMAVIVKLSDGTYGQVLITKEEQALWIGVMNNFYNPIKVVETRIDGIEFK